MQHNSGFNKLVAAVKKNIKQTTIDEVKTKLENNTNFYLIDVREINEYHTERLPHAIHLSKGIIELKIENVAPDLNAEIVLYCGGGSRSALAAESLQRMGYSNVWSMEGGFRGWKNSGHPTEI